MVNNQKQWNSLAYWQGQVASYLDLSPAEKERPEYLELARRLLNEERQRRMSTRRGSFLTATTSEMLKAA